RRAECAGADGATYTPHPAGAALARAIRTPVHDRPGHARQASLRTGAARARTALGRCREGVRTRTGRARREAREAEVREVRPAAAAEARLAEGPAHPGGGQARRVGAGWRPVHV